VSLAAPGIVHQHSISKSQNDGSVRSRKTPFFVIPANPGSGPGQALESSKNIYLKSFWTPVFPPSVAGLLRRTGTGVAVFCGTIKMF
jgi:hypothetical protein